MSPRKPRRAPTRNSSWMGARLLGAGALLLGLGGSIFLLRDVRLPVPDHAPRAEIQSPHRINQPERTSIPTPLIHHQTQQPAPTDAGLLGGFGIDPQLLTGTSTPEELNLPEESAPEEIQIAPSTSKSMTPSIAIIIDDIGYLLPQGQRSALLKGNITLAVIPFSPYAEKLAQFAQHQGKELMLHAPMEPEAQHGHFQGLTTRMDERVLRGELQRMLASLPMVKGVNNHMGSALTQSTEAMSWVMDELFRRNLFFIDSRTTVKTTALEQAKRADVDCAKRDVFLDNVRTHQAIQQQFEKLLQIARTQGSAIAIGHPYPETLSFLEDVLHDLPTMGVKLMTVSQLLQQTSRTQAQEIDLGSGPGKSHQRSAQVFPKPLRSRHKDFAN